VSIGAVIDQRLVDWSEQEGKVGEKLRGFLSRHPAARVMMRDAEFVEGDVHFRRNLPYWSERHAGNGFVLVGEASAFIDPLYSPGMDWIAFTASAAVELIAKCQDGEDPAPLVEKHNRDFGISYQRMFGALYQDKYDYLGDIDLMRVAFRLDIVTYYLYIVRFLYKDGPQAILKPPFSPREAGPFFRFMRFYNRRLAAMARAEVRGVLHVLSAVRGTRGVAPRCAAWKPRWAARASIVVAPARERATVGSARHTAKRCDGAFCARNAPDASPRARPEVACALHAP
jgi:hypothetical protein